MSSAAASSRDAGTLAFTTGTSRTARYAAERPLMGRSSSFQGQVRAVPDVGEA